MSLCIKIAPTKKSDREKTIRAAITSSTALPPPGYSVTDSKESIEIPHLSSKLGWSDPRGLYGYSKDSDYKDLYVYFDYGDKTSPVNELATRAFEMYGLGGAMTHGVKPKWGPIRGSVVLVRIQPDYSFSPNSKYRPRITLDEMYDTLVFFRDSKQSAHKIALKRDSVRFMESMKVPGPGGFGFGGGFGGSFGNGNGKSKGPSSSTRTFYLGPNGLRTTDQVKEDQDKCDHCGKTQSLLGRRLKQCPRCNVTFYCGKDCQKAAWKKHKKICKTL